MLDEVAAAAVEPGDRAGRAERIAGAIRRGGGYRWVGVYDVRGGEIAVLGWSGPGEPASPRFPATRGLGGAAVASGSTVVVGDVTADPRYLTTFGNTRSEMVVPVIPAAGAASVAGLIDVESERPDAFTDTDRDLLQRCAVAIAPLWWPEPRA